MLQKLLSFWIYYHCITNCTNRKPYAMTSNDPEMTIYDPENCLEQIQEYHKFHHEKNMFKKGSLKMFQTLEMSF